MDLFAVVYGVSLAVILALMWRNTRVFDYRIEMSNRVYNACIVDILRKKDANWRHKVHDTVSYNQMLWQFWRKLDSFYPDDAFITIGGDLEKDLSLVIKEIIKDNMPKYIKTEDKVDFDSAAKLILTYMELYAPIVTAENKRKP